MGHRRGGLWKEELPMMKGIVSEERGQALIIMALTMAVLMGFLALAMDGGHAYAQRRLMQNAADAGALAGVRILALEATAEPAIEAATEYAMDRNGGDSVEVTVADQTVSVVARRSFSTFFARVLDWPTLSAAAGARARYGRPTQMQDYSFFPIAVRHGSFVPGGEYEIWDDDKEPDDPPPNVIVGGNRGWLNFDGGEVSGNELKQWVREGYITTVTVGDWINGDPGTQASALRETAHYRIGDTVILAVYDEVRDGQNGNGQLDYHIISFAAFKITSVDDTAYPKWIAGQFQWQYIIGPAGSGDHDGIIAIELMQ